MKYLGIQSLRGVAAMAVVIHHLDVLIAKEKYFGQQLYGFIGESGFRGVDLFFVISGFIMMHSCSTSPERSRLEFALSRILRIFVPYLPIFFTLTLIYILNPSIAQGGVNIDLNFILGNLLLLPRASLESYVPVVAWTLTYELTFYLIFSLTIAKPTRWSYVIFVIWMITCFLNIWWKKEFMCLDPLNLAFGCGILAYYCRSIIKEKSNYIAAAVAVAGIILILKYGSDRAVNPVVDILFILLCGLLCATCFVMRPNMLSRLGDFSYSLYLCHYPIMALSFMVAFKFFYEINPIILSLITIALSLYVSLLYSKIFEIHLSQIVRRKIASLIGYG
jgi:exopolysaccharide production protein ExoZ